MLVVAQGSSGVLPSQPRLPGFENDTPEVLDRCSFLLRNRDSRVGESLLYSVWSLCSDPTCHGGCLVEMLPRRGDLLEQTDPMGFNSSEFP